MIRGRGNPVLKDFRRLWDAGIVSELSDARLLEQFAASHDEIAFDVLMARHGPLVWSVCRSVLRDPNDVEDAFQASFLILVRKAHSLQVGDSLCGWLYRISYRTAREARARRDRRRAKERTLVDGVANASETETTAHASDEQFRILSAEIERLPEKYRLPVILCGLKGLTRNQAASQLGWAPGTVATRLYRGQELLRQRVRRRCEDDISALGAWMGGLASITIPKACREATIRAALALAKNGWPAAPLTSSAFILARGTQRALFWTNIRAGLLIALLGLALVPLGMADKLRSVIGQVPPLPTKTEPARSVLIQGRLTDKLTGKPIRGRVGYAPLKGNSNVNEAWEHAATEAVSNEAGHFRLNGLPGRGVLVVRAGADGESFYPRLHGVTPTDLRQGLAVADDELLFDTFPRPLSLEGSHAYKVIDIPDAKPQFEVDFDLAIAPGRTITVKVVGPASEPLHGVMASGLRDPRIASKQRLHSDGPFIVTDFDAASPRRIFFHQPEQNLAGFVDLFGNETRDITARLSACGSIVGRIVDRAGAPIAGARFGLSYDDGQGAYHVAFPAGRWMPTRDQAQRDERTHAAVLPTSLINLDEASDDDGRFRIHPIVPAAKFRLRIVIPRARRRLGLTAPRNRSNTLLPEMAVAAGQTHDLGDLRILPEELRGDR